MELRLRTFTSGGGFSAGFGTIKTIWKIKQCPLMERVHSGQPIERDQTLTALRLSVFRLVCVLDGNAFDVLKENGKPPQEKPNRRKTIKIK